MKGRIRREVAVSPLPPRLGKIKCGKRSEKGFPQSVDYFIATGKYAPLFDAVYPHANVGRIMFTGTMPAERLRREMERSS